MDYRQRQTAQKLWIRDIMNNEFVRTGGEWESNYVLINDKPISRVNLIANVVTINKSEDETFYSITLDDGSDTIRVKTWKEDTKIFKDILVGDIVLLIGRVKEYNQEIYIAPEIIKKVEPNWEIVRKLELLKDFGRPSIEVLKKNVPEIQEPTKIVEEVIEETPSENTRQLILNLVEKEGDELGVDIDKLIMLSNLSNEEANSIIKELLKEGEVYEIKPGTIKLV